MSHQKPCGICRSNRIRSIVRCCPSPPGAFLYMFVSKNIYKTTTQIPCMNVLQWLSSPPPQIKTVGFEDILEIQKQNTTHQHHHPHTSEFILINTLSLTDQEILICKTIHAKDEEAILNQFLDAYQTANVRIVIYGRNSGDASVFAKESQIRKLGFTQVYVYFGGMFEWLLLQDVYGANTFPTTQPCRDILQYSHRGIFNPSRSYNPPVG
jgi:hypothetical protein